MGTEIRSFYSIKDLLDHLSNQLVQYKNEYEDYSQWLGTLLRDFETDHKNDEWYKKTAVLQKTLRSQSKPTEVKSDKKNAKGKNAQESCWVQSSGIQISFTEQGQTEILFEAIERMKSRIQELEKSKLAIQQLSRLGLGANVIYIVYMEDDSLKKIAIKSKGNAKGDEAFKFSTELSVPAYSQIL